MNARALVTTLLEDGDIDWSPRPEDPDSSTHVPLRKRVDLNEPLESELRKRGFTDVNTGKIFGSGCWLKRRSENNAATVVVYRSGRRWVLNWQGDGHLQVTRVFKRPEADKLLKTVDKWLNGHIPEYFPTDEPPEA